MNARTEQTSITLGGLDGSNPLAFLAALGTLRSLTHAWPARSIKMSWQVERGAWRPRIHASGSLGEDEIVTSLQATLQHMRDHPAISFADDLNVAAEEYRRFASDAAMAATEGSASDGCIAAEFAAAFACDALVADVTKADSPVQDTALRTMSGAGHQHFLAFMRHIVSQTGPEHLRKALFRPWSYDDPMEKQTLRWDPADDIRYALQWRDPSGDPSRKKAGTMLGANRLAIEGLPLLPCMPVGRTLRTTGFSGATSRDTFWTWPIWNAPTDVDVCRSLLASAELQEEKLPARNAVRSRGVVAVYRSRRMTVGKFRNFSPSEAVL